MLVEVPGTLPCDELKKVVGDYVMSLPRMTRSQGRKSLQKIAARSVRRHGGY